VTQEYPQFGSAFRHRRQSQRAGKTPLKLVRARLIWWAVKGSNLRPSRCKKFLISIHSASLTNISSPKPFTPLVFYGKGRKHSLAWRDTLTRLSLLPYRYPGTTLSSKTDTLLARTALTALMVQKFKPPKFGRLEKYDGLVPGFGVRITDKGAKSWIFLYLSPAKNRRRRFTLGPVLSTSGELERARKRAIELRQMVRTGLDPAEAEKATETMQERNEKLAAANRFRSVVELYDKRDLQANRRGWEVKRIIERELLPHWGDKPIATITRAEVLERLEALIDAGKPQAANRLFEVIRRLFNWAYDRGTLGLDRSPCDRMKLPADKVIRQRILNEDEIEAVWGAFEHMEYPSGSMLKLLLITGQRREEVAGMRWAEINMKSKLWTIPPERCKSARPHVVPLSSLAIETLDPLPRFEAGDFVFSTTDGERPVSAFSQCKSDADSLSGVADWRIHDLRRTVRTELARLRVPEIAAERIINHAPRGLARVYDQYDYLDEKREGLEKWAVRLRNIIEPMPENVVALRA
jgi:integrase